MAAGGRPEQFRAGEDEGVSRPPEQPDDRLGVPQLENWLTAQAWPLPVVHNAHGNREGSDPEQAQQQQYEQQDVSSEQPSDVGMAVADGGSDSEAEVRAEDKGWGIEEGKRGEEEVAAAPEKAPVQGAGSRPAPLQLAMDTQRAGGWALPLIWLSSLFSKKRNQRL